MSRTMRSPASSHANSVASSRASRLRAMSIKTGVTMMTTDSAEVETDVFRENLLSKVEREFQDEASAQYIEKLINAIDEI